MKIPPPVMIGNGLAGRCCIEDVRPLISAAEDQEEKEAEEKKEEKEEESCVDYNCLYARTLVQ